MKKIKLLNGEMALVDDADYSNLCEYKWRASNNGYVIRGGSGAAVLMHRQIMQAPRGKMIDHVNGDTLDNRKANLRLATHAQNARNRKQSEGTKSGYKGVYRGTNLGKPWRACIKVDSKKLHIGYYKTKEDAARAYNEAAKKYHGEFARLNDI